MGTWGLNNFENDAAADFRFDVIENGKELIGKALLRIENANSKEYLHASDCQEALLASEFIAASNGRPADDFNESELEWLEATDLRSVKTGFLKKMDSSKLAIKVVENILSESELQELWEEADEFQGWVKIQHDLINRLK